MNRNMNAGRLLYMICLLAFSVVGGKLEAQTVVQPVEQQHDSIKYAPIHQIGFDIRPGYVAPTNSFLEGDNAQQKRIHIILSTVPLNWEIPWRYMPFRAHVLCKSHLVCHLIMSGISVHLSVGRNMTGNTIRRMKLLVLKSMHISI